MIEGPISARVASHTPGRLRIRLDPQHRQAQVMRRVQEHMQDQPGVVRVDSNPSTGSVVVHYDRHASPGEALVGALGDVGVVLRDLVESVGGEELPSEGPGRSTSAVTVVDAVSDLDRRLSELTGRKVDLKLLFPLALGVLGLRQVITSGWGLSEVPAYVVLWYAFDSFWKFHREPAGAVAAHAEDYNMHIPNPRAIPRGR